jgi:uncharacterized protein involved in exopolysaccharide biosynthesis
MNSRIHGLEISSILMRKWRTCLLWALPFGAILTLSVFLLPKKYASEMKILVNNERQDPVISADSTRYAPQPQEESEMQVNSESQLLRSWDVLKDVAVGAGLVKSTSSVGSSPAEFDHAIIKLDKNLSVEPVRKSQIINVTYVARSPEMANRVLHQLAMRYLEAHVQVHNTNGTYQLFEQQASHYADDLSQSELTLADFRKNYSLLVVPEEQQLLAQRATEAQAAYEDIDAQISQVEKRVHAAAQAISRMDTRVVTQKRVVPDSDLVQRLSATLMDLKNRRTEMASKFRTDDRLVVQLDSQIAETQAMLDKANSQSHTEETTDINVVRQLTEKDFMGDWIALAGLRARRDKLKQNLARYQTQLAHLAGATVQHEALLRKVKESEDNYLLYAKKREQARIEGVLDQGRVANVAIAQQPTLTVDPVSPNLLIAIPLAWILALCAGVAIVCGLEFRRFQVTVVNEPLLSRDVAIAS